MNSLDATTKKKSWYKHWWGILLIILGLIILGMGALFGYEFYKIWQSSRSGNQTGLSAEAPYKMAELVDPASPFLGNDKAKIVIVEFGDFNCANCFKAFPIVRELAAKYKDQIKLYWRNFPVIQESSSDLARAAICADKQNKFWAMHDRLFQMQGKVTTDLLSQIAQKAGVDVAKFENCFNSKIADPQLKKDFYAAEAGEVKGTPTFFINGYKIEGPIPLAMWDEIVGQFLKAAGFK